jgi:hypothetical protein
VPPTDPQLQRDRQHLDTLATFYYILAGLQVFSLALIPLYAVYVYVMVCTNAVIPAGSPFPSEIGWVIEGVLGVAFVLSIIWGICLGLTGRDLRLRRRRTFCFVIACLHCIHVPFGTVLGIFTILVLRRPSVKDLFQTGDPPTPQDAQPRVHPYEEQRKDRQWLDVLAICHFALAGLLAFIGVLGVVYLVFGILMLTATPPPAPTRGPPPSFTVLGWIMIAVGIFIFVLLYGQAIAAGLTGYWIRKRKRWLACLAGSGVECLNAPFGIALCVFTVLVLMRPSVRDLFQHGAPPATVPTDEDYA